MNSSGITEIGCVAHARRKFFDLHVSVKSQLADQAGQPLTAFIPVRNL